jgi:hypothetical protein
MIINMYAAWAGFLMGAIAGAIVGLFFHGETWLGGYSSWSRRLVRLGHIAFFGIGFLNLSFVVTVHVLQISGGISLPSWLFIIGAVMMPLVCYLSAWRKGFRHLFFIPAASLMIGIASFLWRIVTL